MHPGEHAREADASHAAPGEVASDAPAEAIGSRESSLGGSPRDEAAPGFTEPAVSGAAASGEAGASDRAGEAQAPAADQALGAPPTADAASGSASSAAGGAAGEAAPKPQRKSSKRKAAQAEPAENHAEPAGDVIPPMDWFILKVQSNREDSIRDAILRRFKIAGLEQYCDQVIVPVERVTEVKAGRKRTRKQKLYPGYVVVHMAITDETWFLVRETPGVGDFAGAGGKPTPMAAHEVKRILDLMKPEKPGTDEQQGKIKFAFKVGDRVKIKEGTFENFEGEVGSLDESSGKVTVMINIFGRSTPVELEYWQVEAL